MIGNSLAPYNIVEKLGGFLLIAAAAFSPAAQQNNPHRVVYQGQG